MVLDRIVLYECPDYIIIGPSHTITHLKMPVKLDLSEGGIQRWSLRRVWRLWAFKLQCFSTSTDGFSLCGNSFRHVAVIVWELHPAARDSVCSPFPTGRKTSHRMMSSCGIDGYSLKESRQNDCRCFVPWFLNSWICTFHHWTALPSVQSRLLF